MRHGLRSFLPLCLCLAGSSAGVGAVQPPSICHRYSGAAFDACREYCVAMKCTLEQVAEDPSGRCGLQFNKFMELTGGHDWPPCGPIPCTELPEVRASSGVRESLAAGGYDVELVASAGSARGHRVHARLQLVALPSGLFFDRDVRLYGWLTGDLRNVGAPLCSDGPAADSGDPGAPGVLLHRDQDGKEYLTVADGSNLAATSPDTLVSFYDGCGTVLYVDEAAAGSFRGRWGAWGLVVDGCGRFEARSSR